MIIRGADLETLHHPGRYTPARIERAALIAVCLNRGKFVLAEPPDR